MGKLLHAKTPFGAFDLIRRNFDLRCRDEDNHTRRGGREDLGGVKKRLI
jgi:hypothetical protein